MPDKVFTMDLKAELADRIERLANRCGLAPEYFAFFLVVDGLRMMEGLENVAKVEPLRDQLKILVELRAHGVLDDQALMRELAELADMDGDDKWEAEG